MRSSEPEVFEIRPDPPWKRSLERIRNAAGRRLQGLLPRRRLENSVSGSRQTFDLSGGEPSFDEISRIVSDPRVCAAIEAIPQGNLAVDLPSPRFPRGYESLGFSKRSRPAAVIDIVPFGLELDTLELRLVELDAVVDRFVVVECERSFGGIRKPLYLKRNWDRFARFHQKIEHVILDPSIVDRVYPEQRRQSSDWKGELAVRSAMWDRVRRLSFPEDPVLVSADADEIDLRPLIDRIVGAMTPRCREVFILVREQHFTYREVADMLGISVSTAQKHMTRAREFLRKGLSLAGIANAEGTLTKLLPKPNPEPHDE